MLHPNLQLKDAMRKAKKGMSAEDEAAATAAAQQAELPAEAAAWVLCMAASCALGEKRPDAAVRLLTAAE